MNIGQAAQASGISAKMIRYYESIELIGPVNRLSNGYRDYSDDDVHMLRFIGKSRDLGFPMPAVSDLLALWRDKSRASRDVRKLANHHIDDLKRRINDMHAMVQTLETLSANCHGDDRPDCPILDKLATG
ncbi:MAG: Cu(I)-responsive transcriptional regulator [Burkholderiaceae bacterium]